MSPAVFSREKSGPLLLGSEFFFGCWADSQPRVKWTPKVGHKSGAGAGAVDGRGFPRILTRVKGKFTAIIEKAPEGGYWAICPEVPGANGQGETVAEAKRSLREAIRLIFEDRVADARRGLPKEAIQAVIAV